MTTHPSWCDPTRCDAVEADEVQDCAGAHRSAVVQLDYGMTAELVRAADVPPVPTFLALSDHKGSRAVAVGEQALPPLLSLLARAGYSTEDGALMAERPADRLKAGTMSAADRAMLDQAYAEARGDLARLLVWVRKVTADDVDESVAAARVTTALDDEPSWDRLMLATTLGVALVRLADLTTPAPVAALSTDGPVSTVESPGSAPGVGGVAEPVPGLPGTGSATDSTEDGPR